MAPEDADRYECLGAQCVLSVQVTQAEQNHRHNLFHTKGVVKECSIRVIIDGGSCNNLASMDMVEKLSDVGWNPRRPIFHERSESLRRTRRTQGENEGKHER